MTKNNINQNNGNEYMTTGELHSALGGIVTPQTLSRYAREGKIPAKRTPGGQYRFRRSDLDRIRDTFEGNDFDITKWEAGDDQNSSR